MPYVAGSNVVQNMASMIGKMLSVSVQNSHRISVKNTSAGIYDSGFLPLEEMVSGPVSPTSQARHAPGTLTANQLFLVTFSFRAHLNLLPRKTHNQSSVSDCLEPGLGICFSYIRSLEESFQLQEVASPACALRRCPSVEMGPALEFGNGVQCFPRV